MFPFVCAHRAEVHLGATACREKCVSFAEYVAGFAVFREAGDTECFVSRRISIWYWEKNVWTLECEVNGKFWK